MVQSVEVLAQTGHVLLQLADLVEGLVQCLVDAVHLRPGEETAAARDVLKVKGARLARRCRGLVARVAHVVLFDGEGVVVDVGQQAVLGQAVWQVGEQLLLFGTYGAKGLGSIGPGVGPGVGAGPGAGVGEASGEVEVHWLL